MTRYRGLFILWLLISIFIGTKNVEASVHLNTPNAATYYIDCQNGSNSNSGTSSSQAWKSLDKANETQLNPGDSLLLKRGCVFGGRLVLPWHGTQENKILISDYGTGDMPKIQNRVSDIENDQHHINVRINGSHIIVENIQTTIVKAPIDTNCENQTRGYYVGFAITHDEGVQNSGKFNIVRNVKAVNHTIGSFIGPGSSNNVVRDSHFRNNNVMQSHTLGRNDELGAWGMLVNGDSNEIAYNLFERNRAWCSYDGIERPSNSIELFIASDNIIHHNVSIDDRVFSELGSNDEKISSNNIFAFNLIYLLF